MVGNVVLRRIGSRTWIPCQLAVRGQDVVDRQAGVVDEVVLIKPGRDLSQNYCSLSIKKSY